MKASLVAFANRYPLTLGMESGEVPHPFTLIPGTPREVARGWARGLFDTGLLSAGALLARPEAERLGRWGIAAAGPVMSVGVFSDRPWKDLKGKPVRDLSSGVTSPLLLSVLWSASFGETCHLVEAADPCATPAALAIGDQALRWREETRFPFFEDLGERWRLEMGAPMPFAFWCVRRGVGDRRRDLAEIALEESRAWARAHPRRVAEAMGAVAGVDRTTVEAYLSSYTVELGDAEEEGWRRFREAARPLVPRAR